MSRASMGRTTNDRILGVLLAGLGILAVLWVRCVWLQVVGRHRYAALGAAQHEAAQTLKATRGAITDRAGQPLAISLSVPSIFANARRVKAKRDVAIRLARAIGRDARAIQRRLERNRAFVWVARHVDPGLVPSLSSVQGEGVGIIEEPTRWYPHGRLASHVVGFVDIDERGLEGLELAFNGALRGQDGWRSTLRDAKGHVLIGPWTTQVEPIDGYDLVLTLDSVVQAAAEETLEWGVKKYHAQGGSVVVLDPATGAIRAMANAPSFDANARGWVTASARRNRAVTDVFEPGSTFKIVTAAALLEEGRIGLEDRIFCEDGSYPTVGRHVLHDHTAHGVLSFHDVIMFSSNIGTAKAAQRLTPEELYRYIRAFGFGRPTGIEVPGEVSGFVHPPARWSKLSPFIIPIGQEVAVTSIQLAVMAGVVANGGLRMRPHLIESIRTPEGRVVRSTRMVQPVRVISPQTAATLQTVLTSVVEAGTAKLTRLEGLSVAGKTGTAQKLEPNGRYSHSRFVASFVGFAPVPGPRVVIVVTVDEPRPLYFGGVVAAPMFKRLVERLASYWGFERVPVPLPNGLRPGPAAAGSGSVSGAAARLP